MKRQEYDHSKLEGTDVNIETSLKEYGLAWVETDKEYLFYYGIGYHPASISDIEYGKFDFCSFDKNMDIKKEFDWIDDWSGVNSFIGMDIADESLPQQIYTLVSYYGYENIFGSSYWEGLDYNEIITEEGV